MRGVKSTARRFGGFFLVAVLCWVVHPVPESQALSIGDIRADVDRNAKTGNIDSIADLAASNPALAAEIAAVAIEANPGMATDISCKVSGAVPDKAVEIASNAAKFSPINSVDIACCIAEAVPQVAAKIAANVANAAPHENAADIAGCVAGKVPERAVDIANMVAQVAPEYEKDIKASVADSIAFGAEVAEDRVPPPPSPEGEDRRHGQRRYGQ